MFTGKKSFWIIITAIMVLGLNSCRGCSSDNATAVCYYEKIMCDEQDSHPFWNTSFHECKPMSKEQCESLSSPKEKVQDFCNEKNFKIGDILIQNTRFFAKGYCEPQSGSKQEKGACFFNEKLCSVNNDIYTVTNNYHVCYELTAEECQDLQETCNETCSINAVDKDSFCTDSRSSEGQTFKYDFKFVESMKCPKLN